MRRAQRVSACPRGQQAQMHRSALVLAVLSSRHSPVAPSATGMWCYVVGSPGIATKAGYAKRGFGQSQHGEPAPPALKINLQCRLQPAAR
jgi:hypothetical protein